MTSSPIMHYIKAILQKNYLNIKIITYADSVSKSKMKLEEQIEEFCRQTTIKTPTMGHKLVILVLFLSYVPPCRGTIPILLRLQNRFQKDIRMILITKEHREQIFAFIKSMQPNSINDTNVLNQLEIVLDEGNNVFDAVCDENNINCVPMMCLYQDDKYIRVLRVQDENAEQIISQALYQESSPS